MKSIYTYYKQRLVEISGKNRSLFSRKITKKNSFDIGKLFDGDYDAIEKLVNFLWNKEEDSFNLLSKDPNPKLFKNLGLEQKFSRDTEDVDGLEGNVQSNAKARLERRKKEEFKKAVTVQVNSVKTLKREIEEFEKETGRYELYIGYPFVQGYLGKDFEVKAPLLLFPVNIDIADETTVNFEIRPNEDIQLNRVLMLAYAQHHKVKNFEELEMSIKGSVASKFKTLHNLIEYLRKFGIRISYNQRKGLFDYEKGRDVPKGHGLEIKHLCVLGRYPLANAIYNDYELLEKRKLTNDAIDELLYSRQAKKSKKTDSNLFTIGSLDFAQENAVQSLNQNGNMVIYGPPGTGKSQTIVNIIADAIAKKKRVLVVSQKRAALDVVFNRLGLLNSKVMYLVDSEKNKNFFYERVKSTHEEVMKHKTGFSMTEYQNIQDKLKNEELQLKNISDVLFTKTEFGLSLSQMYANSSVIGRKSYDYTIYQNMLSNAKLMELDYNRLSESLRLIKEKGKAELYYRYVEEKKNNPYIGNIKKDLDFHILNLAKTKLEKLLSGRVAPFDMTMYPNSRQLVAYFVDKKLKMKSLKPLISFVAKTKHPKFYKSFYASFVLIPALPFTAIKKSRIEKGIAKEFAETLEAVNEYTEDYEFLQEVLTENGYTMTIDSILNGNTLYLKLLLKTLDNYVDFRDLTNILDSLTDDERLILNFAYKSTDTKAKYLETLAKIKQVRIYHEITIQEDLHKDELSKILDYDNIKTRILSLKNEQNSLSRAICSEQFVEDYKKFFEKNIEGKNYLYQITKTQNQWSIRKFMEIYGEFLYKLFPCWLLSPEGVCTILPLVKNMFDIILFDEASQVFIENTLPVIYRGKNIVVAGDTKQLRPTATFMKRFMGGDFDDKLDYSTQAALEVESLLDLAITRYKSANLTYHYRSKNEELINFSNQSFYEGKLQVSPNTTRNKGLKPIERILVKGRWIDRCNTEEVKAVVELLKKISTTRKNNQSIGIITFNSEQESAIEDAIDKEANANPKFRDWLLKEQNRKENGEDISLFVKNLENVQGDERDIIIFSIGYAKNEQGRVIANFGPLSLDGGENRLNVAITRAKEKIYVVTSIEPEELNVENSKNAGPKIFKHYLKYVRAVSNSRELETKILLEQANTQPEIITKKETLSGIEEELKQELEKLGYKVDTKLGNTDYKISVAIYDKTLDRYLLGLECDYASFESSPSVLERDVFRPSFLKSRGWNIIRIWSRDYWMHKSKVLSMIVKEIEKSKASIIKNIEKAKLKKSK